MSETQEQRSVKSHLQIGEVTLTVEEAEETLRAIRAGTVDAVVVAEVTGERIYTFRDPSHPYRVLVEAMVEGAALVTLDGTICYHNPHFASLVSADVDDTLTGRPLTDVVAAEHVAIVEEVLTQGHGASSRHEINLVSPTDDVIPVLLTLSPAHVAEVPVLCVIATDLREHKRQEELYRLARLEIEGRDRLVSVAAHELLNPISVLSMQTQALDQCVRDMVEGKSGPQRALPMVERLNRQTRVLADLVRKLLDVGSVPPGKLALTLEDVDLSEIVRAAVDRSRELLTQSGSSLTLALRRIRGRWDGVRLGQVATNLISNAAKYGGGKPIHVLLDEDKTTGCARLVVQDEGGGIPKKDRERLFRPYERMESTSGKPGRGLGLYIAAEIVRAHGGDIRIEGEEGAGARFVVELPLRVDTTIEQG